jgi:hypothetical protein
MPVTRTLPHVPSPETPLLHEDGKRLAKEWREFFEALRSVLETMRVAIP